MLGAPIARIPPRAIGPTGRWLATSSWRRRRTIIRGGPTTSIEPVDDPLLRRIVIKFSRAIDDIPRFVSELLAVRRPFRLWGIPEFVEVVARIEAVDLHVGHRLRLDIDQNWLRIYLERGSCDNSVARLVSNLQHHFDAALSLIDPELDAALNAGSPPAPADRRRERTPSR